MRQVFSSKLSLLITLIFYSITFGLSGGMSTFISSTKDAIELNYVEKKAATNFINNTNKIDFTNLDDSAWELMGMTPGESVTDFIIEVDKKFGTSWWENTGKQYFVGPGTLASYLLFDSYADENEISYVFEQQKLWEPILKSSQNESFYFLGMNSWDPFDQEYVGYENIYDNKFNKSTGDDDKPNEYIVNEFIVYDGSLEDVYGPSNKNEMNVAVQKDYFDLNNLKIDDKIIRDGITMVVKASFNAPNWIYSVHSPSNRIVNKNEQSVIIANNREVMDIFNGERKFIINYGYNSDYDSFKDSSSFTSGGPAFKKFKDNIKENKTFFNKYGFTGEGENKKYAIGFKYQANGVLTSLASVRISLLALNVNSNEIFLSVLLIIFIGLISILMVLLIRRRIRESSKQLGTLKALGLRKSEIAATFIIFPVVITLLGGGFALGASVFIETLFVASLTNFLSVQLASFIIPFSTILTVFIIPLIFSMIIGYVSAKRIIRKQTLDLLSNRFKNEPNKIIKAMGVFTPGWVGFQTAYIFKGFWRATGKVALLGVSIFGSIALSSLAMSSSTMVDNIIGQMASDINYEGLMNQRPTKYTKFYEDNYKETQEAYHLNLINKNTTPGGGWYGANKNTQKTVVEDTEDNGWSSGVTTLVSIITSSDDFNDVVISKNDVTSYKVKKYLPIEALLQIKSYEVLFITFGADVKELYDTVLFASVTFADLNVMFESSLATTFVNLVKAGEKLNINDLIYKWLDPRQDFTFDNLMEILEDYKTNIRFQDVYYNEKAIIYYQSTNLLGYNEEGENDTRLLSVTDKATQIDEAYNFEEKASKLIGEYEGDNVPIYVSNGFKDWLRKQYDINGKKIIIKDNKFQMETNIRKEDDNKTMNETFDYEIVGTYNTMFSYGAFTEFSFMDKEHKDIIIELNNAWVMEGTTPIKSSTMIVSDTLIEKAIGGEDLRLAEILTRPISPLSGFMTNASQMHSQVSLVYDTLDSTLFAISLFSLLIGLMLVVIAITEIIEASKREVAMLKSFGYSSWKSSMLVLMPYLIIIGTAVAVSIPITLIALGALGSHLTTLSGTFFVFQLNTSQWTIILSFIVGLIILLVSIAYMSFRLTNPLEAIRETDE